MAQCQALAVTSDMPVYIYHSGTSVLPLLMVHDLFAAFKFVVNDSHCTSGV